MGDCVRDMRPVRVAVVVQEDVVEYGRGVLRGGVCVQCVEHI